MRTRGWSLLVAALMVLSAGAGVPQSFNYQGYLTEASGSPVNGTRDLTFRIYEAAASGSALWTETQSGVAVTNGVFSVALGSVNPLSTLAADKWRGSLYLEIQVQTETLAPRQQLVSAPFAITASRVAYDNVVTVAKSGGDATNVYAALQVIAGLPTAPAATSPCVIHVEAGVFQEPGALTIPNYVTVRGAGTSCSTIDMGTNLNMTLGSGCSLEDLALVFRGASGRISLTSATNTHIRGCRIDTDQASPYCLNFQASVGCSFVGNRLTAGTSGLYILYLQTARQLLVSDNHVDATAVAGGTVLFANNISNSVIRGNTIVFEGNTDSSWGLQINNNYSSTRVTGNIFMGETATPHSRDIYNTTTAAYPTRPAHTGAYGIHNQGSDGSELPSF